ncbi:MAG: thioredoxin family protein [Bacteroidota bacterium]
MKIAYTLLLALFFFSLQAQDVGIAFEHDRTFAELLEQAKQEDKLIFVDAYATWCGPCKMMERRVFNQEAVGEFYNANFINLKLDVERGEGPGLARRYRVRAMPTYLFINSDGDIVHTAMGAMQESKFLQLGQTALNGRAR